MNFRLFFFIFSSVSCVFLLSCDFPYAPAQQLPPEAEQTTDTISQSSFQVIPINGAMQTCNPSISQDSVNFKGCMLWLNFSGTLIQNIPDQLSGYAGFSQEHDRITVTDTSNTVRWYIKIEELGRGAGEEFQDPEWSTHPEYIVCLASSDYVANWSCYAIHTLSKDTLDICHDGMDVISTPHLWAPNTIVHQGESITPQYDSLSGFVDRESVRKFFGTDTVKLIYARKESGVMNLYYIDYSNDSGLKKLKRPTGRDGWNLESPLISPDGKWILFNAYQNIMYYESYIQELTPGSTPVLLGGGISNPHWWVHPDDKSLLYIIYTAIPGDNLVSGDLSDPNLLISAEAGITCSQQVKLFSGRSSFAAIKKIGSPEVLVNLPMKGGLSPDGRYICTGYERAYIVKIN